MGEMAGSNDIEVTFITSTTLVGVVIIALFVVAFRTPSITSTRLAAPPFRAFRVAVAIAIGVQWLFLYRAATVMPHRAAWPITGRHSFVRIGRWGSRSLAWRVRLISPSHLTLPLPLPLPPPLPLSLAAQVVRQDCVASTKGGKVAGSWRDCKSGQGGRCTAAEPCTPCNDAPLFANGTAFGSTCVYPNNHRDSICHCALCTAPIEGSSGNCGFHAAAGPFCTSTGLAAAPVDLSGNALAVPCVRCCSRAKA